MKIFTFYNKIEGFNAENETALIELWKKSWSQHGYEPVVISDTEARKNPRFSEFDAHMAKLPTVNGYEYEGACYRRWLAMEMVAEGPCLMSDYDVMCYGDLGLSTKDKLTCFSLVGNPTNDEEGIKRLSQSPNAPTDAIFAWVVPCLVYGDKKAFTRIVDMFMSHQTSPFDWIWDNRPHTSDQFIITQNRYSGLYDVDFKCLEAFRGNWMAAPAVHYPNGVMTPRNLTPRHMHIPTMRKFHAEPNRKDIPAIQIELGVDGPGAEIGVANGDFTEYLAPKCSKLYAIDPWKVFSKTEWFDCINSTQANLDAMAAGTARRLSKYPNVEIMRKTSQEASTFFADGSLAWAFIDANHQYEACLNDMNLWYPKVKNGGFLCGHDYCTEDNVKTDYVEIGVGKAVREFCKVNGLAFEFGFGPDGMWIIYKK